MSYTLDTSAVLAYFLDKAGADEVQEILKHAEKGEEVFVSFMELLYRIWKLNGEHEAKKSIYCYVGFLCVKLLRVKIFWFRQPD
jgi:predicted nucleic acid-binding protein